MVALRILQTFEMHNNYLGKIYPANLGTSVLARILQKTLDTQQQKGAVMRETDTLIKTRDYLEIFSVFKENPDAQALEAIVNV
jgi:hypothetical protein